MSVKTFQLKAVLVSPKENNKPLSGKTIKFYYRKKDEATYISFSSDKVTDSNGVAISDRVQLTDQEYYFKVVFEGDANYEGSYAEKLYSPTAQALPFDITGMMPMMLMMVMMFLLMTVLGFLRRPKEEE